MRGIRDFPPIMRVGLSYMALAQARRFLAIGEADSARTNWILWRENCFWLDRLKEALRPLARRVLGRDGWYNH